MEQKKSKEKKTAWSSIAGQEDRLTFKQFFPVLLSMYTHDNISILASGMVYSTLIAFVPCVTFFVMIFGALGVLDPFLEVFSALLIEVFGDTTGLTLSNTITDLTKNAGTLGAFGMISFIVTFILLINKLWTIINNLYKTKMETNPLRRLMTILMVVIMGSILLAVFFSVKTKFSSWYPKILGSLPVDDWKQVVEAIVSKLILWLVIFCMMIFVPNTTVKGSSAFYSSFLVTVEIILLNLLFSFITKRLVNYSIIYGSLSVVFLFLLWIYILWTIVLVGIELCFVLQFKPTTGNHNVPRTTMTRISEVLNIMCYVSRKYIEGNGASGVDELERGLLLTGLNLSEDVSLLEHAGLLLSVSGSRPRYVPGRPPKEISLSSIAKTVLGKDFEQESSIGFSLANDFKESGLKVFGDKTLDDLIQEEKKNVKA